ncbi:hypothetical protein OBCHQ24_04570 [Oceanobacillus iheyensis]|nr:hypothetical protein OBCHQ24_04570 [Oceanobacillus iheyensis]
MLTANLGITTNKNVDANKNKLTEIGTALNAVSIPSAAYGKSPNGEEWIYAVAGGSPAVLNIVAANTGKLINSFSLEGASNAWGVTVDPNGIVYIGSYSSANLYRYVPGEDLIENLGNPIPGEIFIWRISSDDDGRIYGGTYPGGKVFQYNPNTREFRDYGQMAEGQQYARSIDLYQNKAYVGAGTEEPHLIELDVETGETLKINLPEKFADQSNVYDINIVGNKLFARLTGINTLLVFDLKTMEIIDEIENASGLDVSPTGTTNLVYLSINGSLHSYNLNSLKLKSVGFEDFGTAIGFGWMKVGEADFPGETLVSIASNGEVRKYNPETGNVKVTPSLIIAEPVEIQSLTQGPNGNIFIGGFFSGGLAEYNYQTNQLKEYKGLGQIEGMITHNDQLYMGIYPGAYIHSYNPNEPYACGNPVEHFRLQDKGQDRPFAMISADDKLAIGTVPNYGELGGALTIYDPETGDYTFHQNVVKNQSVISLAYCDGLIFGGTSVWGGLGITPSEGEAKLFIWDVENEQKVLEIVPVSGEKAISALTFDNKGYLWGITSGILFKYSIKSNRVVQQKKIYSMEWDSVSHLWRGGFLKINSNGNLYGQTHDELFIVNTETFEHEVLVNNASLFTQDPDGNFYFAREHKLYQYKTSVKEGNSTNSYKNTTLLKGEVVKLNLEIILSNRKGFIDEAEVEWVITNPNVVTIEDGRVIGSYIGRTDIHAVIFYKGKKITSNMITVTVHAPTSNK